MCISIEKAKKYWCKHMIVAFWVTNPCRITRKVKQTKMYVCTLEEFILVDIWGVLVLLKFYWAPDNVEFVLGRFSHFNIAIAYSNSAFCGAWTPSLCEFTQNFSKTSTPLDTLLCKLEVNSIGNVVVYIQSQQWKRNVRIALRSQLTSES